MTEEVDVQNTIAYEAPKPAGVWENTVFAMIRSRPFASIDVILERADAITNAYRERFFHEEEEESIPAQILYLAPKGDI
jgi:hypothetical protein